MPYILVRGNLASYGHRYPWRVLVSGLKASDIEQLTRFASGGYCDDSTIVYLQHPCVILTALEVLGYKVVASSSTSVKQDYNEYMWTMRKDFSEPEPELVIKAPRMERHLERCLKCPGEVRRQFVQVRNDKRNKANVLGVKVNDKQRKRESSLEHVADLELDGLDDWHYKNRYYTDEMSETIQQCDAKIVIQSKDKSLTSHDSNVQSIRGDGSAKIRTRDSSQTDAEMAKIDGSEEHKGTIRRKKSLPARRISRWPFLSIRDPGYSPLQSKIYQEQLLESRASRKIAELELRRKTLELERFQWEFERDKAQSEIRWAYEMRMMQLQEEHERKLIDQNRNRG
ncbi:hypothetical protein HZH68_014679 [Vespula germanica]|uniref:Uncharacterized protein n=1 Tax=Vespula germanica TaxID=30212 RepID=A0A834JB18_VESGE|nr:hypothetical protein HZH68_014679 [Vespula germanica]